VVVASAALLGLLARERFGIAQSVYVDMLCANAHANFDAFLHYPGMEPRPVIDEDHFGTGPCHRLYPAAGGWVFLALTTQTEWQRFCVSAECAELLADSRFETESQRSRNASSLAEELANVFARRSASEWQDLLGRVNVACVQADAASPGSFYAHHEQMRVNGFVPVAPHARFGAIRRWGPLVTVGGPFDSLGPGVLAGEHTDRLLAELGYVPDQIARLRSEGIAGSEPTIL